MPWFSFPFEGGKGDDFYFVKQKQLEQPLQQTK